MKGDSCACLLVNTVRGHVGVSLRSSTRGHSKRLPRDSGQQQCVSVVRSAHFVTLFYFTLLSLTA